MKFSLRDISLRSALIVSLASLVGTGLLSPRQVSAQGSPGTASSSRAAPAVAGKSPVLAPGDMLNIAVYGRPELSGQFQIAPDGTIIHPLYRNIVAAGVPMPELDQRIRTFLLGFQADPQFVIAPLFRVFVFGEVVKPSPLEIPPGTTLGQAIAIAGGPTPDARMDRIQVLRNLQPIHLDLTGGDSVAASFTLESNDQVVVGRNSKVFRDVVVPTITFIGGLAGVANLIYLVSTRR